MFQVDIDHLHHWMQAIRQSPDPMRTMDAFWKGQLSSKEWLVNHLLPFVTKKSDIDIYGGWVGVLASMIFQSSIPVQFIRSIDIDPTCKKIATDMNKIEEMSGKFLAITADMCTTKAIADIVINTSCEHITQEQYNQWLENVPDHSLILLQSNNYQIPEHVRIAKSIDDFKKQSGLNFINWAGQLELPMYTRYMIIGRKA